MARLFGRDMAGIMGRALGKHLLPATLTKNTPGTVDPDATIDGTNPTERNLPCKGFIESFQDNQIDGTIILRSDRKVTILGATVSGRIAPEPNDDLTIEGTTYKIVPDGVSRDPAAATYVCHCRSR